MQAKSNKRKAMHVLVNLSVLSRGHDPNAAAPKPGRLEGEG